MVRRGPIIVGHRGICGYPKSSLAAFRAALALGVEMIEFDVRCTRDGELVVFHDARLPSGRLLRDSSCVEMISELGEVTFVEQVAQLAAEASVAVQVDLKEVGSELRAIDAVESIVGADRIVVTTLDDVSVAVLKRARGPIPVGLSLGRGIGDPGPRGAVATRASEFLPWRRVRRCGADFLSVQVALARAGVFLQARALGFPVFVWTVDDPALIRRVLRWRGLAGLVTNRADVALTIRKQLS